jgi:uncharacterized lipoprotein YmbA
MSASRFPLVLLLAGLLGLTGCSLMQQQSLYQLDGGTPVTASKKKGPAVLLGPVDIAQYLQGENLVQRQPDNSLINARHARWAGKLSTDIDQLLLRQLAAKLGSQEMILAPATAGFTPDVQVLLDISRLDSGPEHPAVLEAQWRLLDRSGKLRDTRIVRLEQAHSGTPADQVEAQSYLLRQLADQLAAAIEPVSKLPSIAEQPRQAPQKRVEDQPRQPDIPAVERVGTNVEVFRF